MILLDNNYCSKYWNSDEIKDCCNSVNNIIELNLEIDIELNLELSINNEKLKDNDYNILNNNNLNDNPKYENSIFNSRNRTNEDKSNKSGSKYYRTKNKNNRIINTEQTNKYINLQRDINTNNNKKKVSEMPSSCRISEYKGRNLLLGSYPKPKLKNLL
jgi:hypothetical protein